MNRFFTLLAVVALAAVATQAQRPIRISAVAGDNMMMLPYTSGGLSTQQAAGVLPNETMPEGPYRMSPLEQIYIQNDQLGPLTDSSIYIKSVDGSGDSAHIGWRYPSAIGDQSGNILYQQTGLGQVFTSLPGTFRIDSLIMLIYSTDAPPNFSKLNSPLRWIPFYVSTNVRSSTYRGLREAFDNLEFLNSDYEEISASTVAGQVQGNSVRAFTMNFSNPINIDKNRHFGFIFRKTDNDPGNFFMLGQYEWALTRNQCLGVSIDRHKANDPSSDTLKTLAHNIV
ncbi:MAG: hypothetical protein JNL32_01450, partial [Candidatus Kapabacteria bacterium]|nr:hypothetical protein [Candidatus Kapabacteria bacterium]